jgi:hypothetical protein
VPVPDLLAATEAAPVEVLADSGYGSAATGTALAEAGHVTVIKPIPLRTAAPVGFTIDDFTIRRHAVPGPLFSGLLATGPRDRGRDSPTYLDKPLPRDNSMGYQISSIGPQEVSG